MNQVAVKALASSNRKIAAASTRKKPSSSKNDVTLDKNEKKNISVSNDNTQQTTLTQWPFVNPPEPPLHQHLIIQHLYWANAYPMRTPEEFYASKKSHRGAVVQYGAQMEALMDLLQDIQNNSKLHYQPG